MNADQADVAAARGGDGESYARLVHRHQPGVAAYLWRFTRDRREWEELVHDVFVEAYFSLPGYRAQAPLAHWLRRIATRVGYRYWKRRARLRVESPLLEETWDRPGPADGSALDARQAGEEVHAALARLGPRDRLVLTLFYLEGSSVAQIAALAGWNQAMVKVQLHRARNRLKRLLETQEDAP